MIYAMPITKYGLPCVQICDGDEPYPEGATYPVPEGTAWEDLIIDSGVCREKTDEEKQAFITAQVAAQVTVQVAAQLAKSETLKFAENKFLTMCDQLTGSASHAKLGFDQIQAIIAQIPDQGQALYLGATLLAIDAECKREGGNRWWNDCCWHPEMIGA